jgi:lysozyme
MTTNIDAGLSLVKQFEGCRLTAYQDIVGVWTIGYGETKGVYPGMVITQDQADAMVKASYEQFQAQVQKLVKVPINQNQLGALTSFAYNLGIGALAGSTLLKLLNAGQPASVVAQQFLRWNMAGGKVVAGLTARRAAEAKLFLSTEGV